MAVDLAAVLLEIPFEHIVLVFCASIFHLPVCTFMHRAVLMFLLPMYTSFFLCQFSVMIRIGQRFLFYGEGKSKQCFWLEKDRAKETGGGQKKNILSLFLNSFLFSLHFVVISGS